MKANTYTCLLCIIIFLHCSVVLKKHDPVVSLPCVAIYHSLFPINRGTHQCIGPCANADEILMAQTEVVVVVFQHVRHTDTQLLPLRIYIIWQPPSWKRHVSVKFSSHSWVLKGLHWIANESVRVFHQSDGTPLNEEKKTVVKLCLFFWLFTNLL